MHSSGTASQVLLMIAGVPALAYGILAGVVWLNNTLMHSPGAFIGQVDVLGLPVIVDGPSLGWMAALLIAFGVVAVWKAQAESPSDE